jgi:AcrR family transcriptional regulator
MDEVARRARCSKPTLYRRWRNKAALIIEVVSAPDTARVEPIDTGSLKEDLRLLLHRIVAAHRRRGLIFLGIAHAMQSDAKLAAAWHSRGLAGGKAILDTIMTRAIRRGELQHRPGLELLHNVLPGSFLWAIHVERVPDPQVFADSLLERVVMPSLLHGQAPAAGGHAKRATAKSDTVAD